MDDKTFWRSLDLPPIPHLSFKKTYDLEELAPSSNIWRQIQKNRQISNIYAKFRIFGSKMPRNVARFKYQVHNSKKTKVLVKLPPFVREQLILNVLSPTEGHPGKKERLHIWRWCVRCLLITESPKTPSHYRYQT